MKTLTDHTIIYDDECPMCNLYTRAFVKTKMLDKEGREAYSQMVKMDASPVDWERAKNEIALLNRKDNTVQYGVDSIMAVLSHNRPFFKSLFRNPVFHFLAERLYFFISYNRKAIIPGNDFEGTNACTPRMSYSHRWAYVIFAWLVTSVVLLNYSGLLIPYVPATRFSREFLICGGQIIVQGIVVLMVRRERAIHYLGNMMTVSLAGALLLLPALALHSWIGEPMIYMVWFFLVVGWMFFEHARRVRILELPWYISATWVLYRIIVLLIIL